MINIMALIVTMLLQCYMNIDDIYLAEAIKNTIYT